MQSIISEVQTDSDIKRNSLVLLRNLEKNLTTKERQDIIDLLLYIVKENYDLSEEVISDIRKSIKGPKKFCNHIYKSGAWIGTKCLNQKKQGEVYCEKHL